MARLAFASVCILARFVPLDFVVLRSRFHQCALEASLLFYLGYVCLHFPICDCALKATFDTFPIVMFVVQIRSVRFVKVDGLFTPRTCVRKLEAFLLLYLGCIRLDFSIHDCALKATFAAVPIIVLVVQIRSVRFVKVDGLFTPRTYVRKFEAFLLRCLVYVRFDFSIYDCASKATFATFSVVMFVVQVQNVFFVKVDDLLAPRTHVLKLEAFLLLCLVYVCLDFSIYDCASKATCAIFSVVMFIVQIRSVRVVKVDVLFTLWTYVRKSFFALCLLPLPVWQCF